MSLQSRLAREKAQKGAKARRRVARGLTRNANRSCGECTACCTALLIKPGIVSEKEKPQFQPCPKLCASGCSIYAKRPTLCREFVCFWKAGVGEVEDRPDRIGFVLTEEKIKGVHVMIATPLSPQLYPTPDQFAHLKHLALETYERKGVRVVWDHGYAAEVDYRPLVGIPIGLQETLTHLKAHIAEHVEPILLTAEGGGYLTAATRFNDE